MLIILYLAEVMLFCLSILFQMKEDMIIFISLSAAVVVLSKLTFLLIKSIY